MANCGNLQVRFFLVFGSFSPKASGEYPQQIPRPLITYNLKICLVVLLDLSVVGAYLVCLNGLCPGL